MDVRHHTMRYESLVVCALHKTIQEQRTSSPPKAENAFFLGTHFVKRAGKCVTWRPMRHS